MDVLISVWLAQNRYVVDWTVRQWARVRERSFPNKRHTLHSISTKDAQELIQLTPAVSCAAVSIGVVHVGQCNGFLIVCVAGCG